MKNTPSTKIDFNCNKIARLNALDDLARMLFPGNRNHQRVFLAVYIELKYAQGESLPSLGHLCEVYRFSPRTLETVRSKMRRMGLIDHVSRFNKKHGYREGWIFSTRFSKALIRVADLLQSLKSRKDPPQERKDRDLFLYL